MPMQETVELSSEELEVLLKRLSEKPTPEDLRLTEEIFNSYVFIYQTLKSKNQSIKNLQKLIFGSSSEKSQTLFKDTEENQSHDSEPMQDEENNASRKKIKGKKKGCGRLSKDDYPNAVVCPIKHPTLKEKDQCPLCQRGKVYPYQQANTIVKISGNTPLMATKYQLENFRCNTCGEIFRAELPVNIPIDKYDHGAISMIALLKYGTGMPFFRLDKFLKSIGTPVPKSTQWDLLDQSFTPFEQVFESLCYEAAQGEILYNDDTSVKILSLENRVNRGHQTKGRKGLQTTGIVSRAGKHKMALFFSGHQHAGENLEHLLDDRQTDQKMPIQMCDGKKDNIPKNHKTIVSNCMAHARRKYVELVDNFPEQCRYIIGIFKSVYENDLKAKKCHMTPEQRLKHHKSKSLPLMVGLSRWFEQQFEEKKIEPNSNLGAAIHYMKKRWDALLKFTEVAGAPLDNNICEQALKKPILLRKNAYFYKTERGAKVGDVFISLIQTCEMNNLNSFEYLKAILDNKQRVLACPENWTPFKFRENLLNC